MKWPNEAFVVKCSKNCCNMFGIVKPISSSINILFLKSYNIHTYSKLEKFTNLMMSPNIFFLPHSTSERLKCILGCHLTLPLCRTFCGLIRVIEFEVEQPAAAEKYIRRGGGTNFFQGAGGFLVYKFICEKHFSYSLLYEAAPKVHTTE